MACEYPDASSPGDLWANVLACRQSFRPIPRERIAVSDYTQEGGNRSDSTYVREAAVLEGYRFDRSRFSIPASTCDATDLTHWLALDVAARALENAGFPHGQGLDRAATGVVVGNTLAGEFSRAGLLRLRWPWVKRVLKAHIAGSGLGVEDPDRWMRELEARYKAPFPPSSEDSLAGGLSNTIAGRICNHFDFQGGGFTVDGACASSLVAVHQACTALRTGYLSTVLVGGVDLSLDPFELIGFASVGALARGDMQVYAQDSAGFLPGEGCGMVLLMRGATARAHGLTVRAWIRGTGISSDGRGSMTRPEVRGQELALRRAYDQAGVAPDRVSYIEGHGTGTVVGDRVEVRALASLLQGEGRVTSRVALGSVKANIGHTKAAAGVAGLIKTVMALQARVLPPTTGWREACAEIRSADSPLRLLRAAEPWPEGRGLFAGVSAFGFGGINAHLVVEGEHGGSPAPTGRILPATGDGELLVLAADSRAGLVDALRRLVDLAGRISRAQLIDLAAHLTETAGRVGWRAAILAHDPRMCAERARRLSQAIAAGVQWVADPRHGGWFSDPSTVRPLVFLFPGQGGKSAEVGRAFRLRFPWLVGVLDGEVGPGSQVADTRAVQMRIAQAALVGIDLMMRCRIRATAAVGHSVGEFAALAWAGAIARDELLPLLAERGTIMAEQASGEGLMASVGVTQEEVAGLLTGSLVVAAVNGLRQIVISGTADDVRAAVATAKRRGWPATILAAAGAFHSPLYGRAAAGFTEVLKRLPLSNPGSSVISTVSARLHGDAQAVRDLLGAHMTSPVRWRQAVEDPLLAECVMVELGFGRVLSDLVDDGEPSSRRAAVALDLSGDGGGLLQAMGAAWVNGQDVDLAVLTRDRRARPIDLAWRGSFLANPCELAERAAGIPDPAPALPPGGAGDAPAGNGHPAAAAVPAPTVVIQVPIAAPAVLACLRSVIAERTQLPEEAISDAHQLLGDLHLGSLAVGQIIAEATLRLGLGAVPAPTEYATATIAEIAAALASHAVLPAHDPGPSAPAWVRALAVDWIVEPLDRMARHDQGSGTWRAWDPPGGHPRSSLMRRMPRLPGPDSLIAWMPTGRGAIGIAAILEISHRVIELAPGAWMVLVQEAHDWSAWMRCLHAEAPHVRLLIVTVDARDPDAEDRVADEAGASLAAAAESDPYFNEVCYGLDGLRHVRRARIHHQLKGSALVGATDHVLVTGGAKGIVAECALALVCDKRCRLLLCGRSPAEDSDVAGMLSRLTHSGVDWRYVACDLTDQAQVSTRLGRAIAERGPVTVVIHGAGVNEPRRIDGLDVEAATRPVATKVAGLEHVLAVIDPGALRVLVGFGSIIAEIGLAGEAAYALANAWLAERIDGWVAAHPACTGRTIAWSVWSGVGMGERLGSIAALRAGGIHPLSVEEGTTWFLRLMEDGWPQRVTVTGAFGQPRTLPFRSSVLPLWRFLEEPLRLVPECELVVGCRLSPGSDPYLDDHRFQGVRLLPAVMALEAMAQAACAVSGQVVAPRHIIFADAAFRHAITIPDEGEEIRIVALVLAPGHVEVAIHCRSTAFQVEHARATVRWDGVHAPTGAVPHSARTDRSAIPISDLYGRIAFQGPRFQRLAGYDAAHAASCSARLTGSATRTSWFDPCLPQTLLLPDAGARDAVLHCLQVCIPHATILPVGIASLRIDTSGGHGLTVHGVERANEGARFTYDLDVLDADGTCREWWRGVELVAVDLDWNRSLPAAFLPVVIERRLRRVPALAAVRCAMAGDGGRRVRRAELLARLGAEDPQRRGDGKVLIGNGALSISHADGLSLGVMAAEPVGCDLVMVPRQAPAAWQALLGPVHTAILDHLVATTAEGIDRAGARVWAAREALVKLGIDPLAPMALATFGDDGAVVFRCGGGTILTFPLACSGEAATAMVAIAGCRASVGLMEPVP
jgi:enediyne polyketide synthase